MLKWNDDLDRLQQVLCRGVKFQIFEIFFHRMPSSVHPANELLVVPPSERQLLRE